MRKIISHLKDNWIKYGFETFVVVFGILVAFALNNWSEGIKIKMEEKTILKGLQTEMLENRESLMSAIELHEIGANHHKSLLQHLYLQDTLKQDESFYDSLWKNAFGPRLLATFDPAYGNVKSIITSGKLSYISNRNLATLIASFEDKVNDTKEFEQDLRNIHLNHILPLSHNYTSRTLWNKTITQSNFRGFSEDKKIYPLFTELYWWRGDILNEEKDLLKEIDKILELIEKEIDQ